MWQMRHSLKAKTTNRTMALWHSSVGHSPRDPSTVYTLFHDGERCEDSHQELSVLPIVHDEDKSLVLPSTLNTRQIGRHHSPSFESIIQQNTLHAIQTGIPRNWRDKISVFFMAALDH
jgi:hypothetical protein